MQCIFELSFEFESNLSSLLLYPNDCLWLKILTDKFKSKLLNPSDFEFVSNSRESSKIHCIHSIFISLFRIVIDFKDIKLSKQVYEELKEIDNSNVTEKKHY